MKTEYLSTNELERAAELLRSGQVVAFATETVYGLGADALNPDAIDKVFRAKGRPSNNPLIVHLHDRESLNRVVESVPPIAEQWIERFWPGPLTIVMPKHPSVPLSVTANLNSVAVRVPNHPTARELIRRCGTPIAAPSANRSGKPSSTTWQAVAEDLDGLIAAIVCDDPTEIGVESTVVDATSRPPRILRSGGLSWERLAAVTPEIEPYRSQVSDGPVYSPGLLHKHYQPRAQVILVESPKRIATLVPRLANADSNRELQQAYIGLEPPDDCMGWAAVATCESLEAYAAKLFDFFRQADRLGVTAIWCQRPPEIGIGVAIADRLRRASEQG